MAWLWSCDKFTYITTSARVGGKLRLGAQFIAKHMPRAAMDANLLLRRGSQLWFAVACVLGNLLCVLHPTHRHDPRPGGIRRLLRSLCFVVLMSRGCL